MKLNPKYFPWLIIGILIALLFLQRECSRCPEVVTDTEFHIDTIKLPGDAVPVEVKVPYPVPVPYQVDHVVEVPAKIDTGAVVAAFYTPVMYRDTFVNDTSYRLILAEKVHKNRIADRQIWVQNLRAKEYITKTITTIQKDTPRTKLYLGVSVGRWVDQFALGGSIAVNTKKDHLYTGTYDFLNNSVYVTSYWKIRVGRR
jgi:hypothetical protein